MLRRRRLSHLHDQPFPNRHTAYQVSFGFSETYDTGKGGLENADEMYLPAKAWLDANGRKDNWFLHVNWDPHTPYDHPAAFINPFADEPIEEWITQDPSTVRTPAMARTAPWMPGYDDKLPPIWTMGVGHIRTAADAKTHMDGYDTGIRYADFYVGKLVDDLKRLGIYDDTVIIVSADHGETRSELNIWGDYQTADHHIKSRVPLIVRWPGDRWPGRRRAQTDCTITSTFRRRWPSARRVAAEAWDGASFCRDLAGSSDNGRDYLVISQGRGVASDRCVGTTGCSSAPTTRGWKDFPAYMPFDIEADPHEPPTCAAAA